MSKEQVISKGKYTRPQPKNMVGVKQYLFVRGEDGGKRLLLRFANDRHEKCSKFAFILYRLDAKGNVLGQDKYESADKEFLENQTFSFDRQITVEEKCSDFRVQMVYARYGNYTYNVEHENVSVAYSERNTSSLEGATHASKVKPRKIMTRAFDMPWLFAVLSVLMLSLVVFVCGYLLSTFMKEEVDFTLKGVDYRFTDKEKKDEVIIMGCANTYREITLTGEIEGHKVAGIDDDAFENNKNLVIINIDGLNVPEGTFEDCKKLEVLTIKNVTEIGEDAFRGCSSLEKVTIDEGKVGQILTLGKRAFAECSSLKEVEINQTLAYGEDADYFYKSKSIESLKLKNFAYTAKGLSCEYVTRLAALFGEEGSEKNGISLANLTVEKMDAIPERFVYGFKKLQSVTVSSSDIKTVGDSAFEGCTSLKTLSLKGKLQSIGNYAFASTGIETLDMTKVKSLGVGVFKNNTKLTSVKGFGEGGIDSVPKNTFDGCVALKSFTFHKNVKHVFSEAFKNTGLTKISIPAGVTYDAGILKDSKKLVTLEVYEFGAAGFVGQLFGADRDKSSEEVAGFIPNTLTTVTLGSGREINESAFKGCKNVTTINLPGDIISIGDNAFSGCKKLTVVDIPADSITLKTIGDRAFYKCEKLKYVPLLDTLEKIGQSALEGCNSLESVTLPFLGATPALDDENETVSYVFGGSIPASIKEMALLDSSVVSLPDGAFKGCSGVKKITMPNNVASIGASAFEGCKALTVLALSDGTSKDIGADLTRVSSIGASAFKGCSSLSTSYFGDKLDIIGASAFESAGLAKISIPQSVTYIGEGIFKDCKSLGTVCLPYLGATSTENGKLSYFFGFEIPESLKSVEVLYFDGDVIGADAFSGSAGVTSFKLPYGIVAVSEGAFRGCTSLNTFNFSEIVTVGDGAFYGCLALKDLDLSGLAAVGDSAFYGCAGLTKVNLASAGVVGERAFEKCSALASVALGEGVYKIGEAAFAETAIKNIAVPNSITVLEDYVFSNCKALASVSLPEGLTHIGDGVFRDTALTSVSIPDGVKYIGGFVFKNTAVKELKIPKGTEYVGINVIEGCEKLERLELPLTDEMSEQSVAGYIANGAFPHTLTSITVNGCASGYIQSGAFAYSYNLEEIIITADVYDIYWNAFGECNSLRYVSLPSTLEYIDYDAFNGCYRLYEISNPSQAEVDCIYTVAHTPSLEQRAQTVTKDGNTFARYNGQWYLIKSQSTENLVVEGIGGTVDEFIIPPYLFFNNEQIKSVVLKNGALGVEDRAFENCVYLTSVNMADTVKYIGSQAFAHCYSLREAVMPTALEVIGDYAFLDCSELNGIKLYGNLSEIGEDAFYGCRNLYDVYNSSRLNIKAGSRDYGYVARRAVKVHTDMNAPLSVEKEVKGIGMFRTTGDAWLLLSGEDTENLRLGEFTSDGKTVKAYRILEDAFVNRYRLRSVVITDAVKQIQSGAFSWCYGLVSVDFSENQSITELEEDVFFECHFLETVKLPSKLKYIGDYAFFECNRLESVNLPNGLEIIGEGAFSGCERLISIRLGESLKEIGEEAFAGCTYLIEVYDLSPYIDVSRFSWENGCVAANAAAVFTSDSVALERKEQNGFKFIYGNNVWYLYDFEDKGKKNVEIPNLGAELVIIPYSVENGSFEGIVFPANLSAIKYNGISNCAAFSYAYYMGEEEEWYEIEGGNEIYSFQTVYYYKDCVHYYSYFAWTRDENGEPTTNVCKETALVTKAPTCYENGETVYNCDCEGCDYSRREAVDRLAHEFDGNICKNCGGEKKTVDANTVKDLSDRGVIGIDGFVYDENSGAFVSTNKDGGTMSVFSIEAKGNMTLSFTIEASSLKDCDYVTVYENGVKCEMISGRESSRMYFFLEEGDVILIAYEKSYYGSGNNDCGYVMNVEITEEKEQQSN